MLIYDKLMNIETDEKFFEFICPCCKTNGMEENAWSISPIGVSWKNAEISNDDLPTVLKIGYNSLPTLRQAILIAHERINEGKYLDIECNKCKTHVPIWNKIDTKDLRQWLNINLPTMYLKMSEEEKDARREKLNRSG